MSVISRSAFFSYSATFSRNIFSWYIILLFVGISRSFLVHDSSYEKNRDILWEAWFSPFLTLPSHTIYLEDNTFISYEQSTIIDSLFIGTYQLRKLSNGSFVVGNLVSNTKYGIIGLVHLDSNNCESLGWNHYNSSCFLAIKRVNVSNCTSDNVNNDSNKTSCSLIIKGTKIQDIFTEGQYTVLGSINEEVPMQRLDVSAQIKSLFFISRNFDESKISEYQTKFRDFFNYNVHRYSLVDNKITNTLLPTFADSLKYLSAPIWVKADLVPKCLTLVHYDDLGFLVANILDYEDLSHKFTVTLGSIQTGSILEFSKTINTPKIIVLGDTQPYEKIVIVNGNSGEIQRHDLYPSS